MLGYRRSANQLASDVLRVLAKCIAQLLGERRDVLVVARTDEPGTQVPDVVFTCHAIWGTRAYSSEL
jgi:hypothetical protein